MCLQADGKWKWAARHPWQSWRERYKNKQLLFEQQINKYQKKKGIKSEDPKQKAIVRKKSARRRDAVDEGQSDQEVDQLRQSDSDRERAKEKKRKRKRIEEKVERKTKKAKKEEEEDADAIEGDQVQKRTQNQTAIRRSSPGSHDEEEEETDGSTDERKGPAGSNDYSAELFGSDDDNEIIEDSEKVSGDLDEDRSMSEDVTGDDEDGDVTVNTHVKGYVTLARSGSLNIFSSSSLIGQGLRRRAQLLHRGIPHRESQLIRCTALLMAMDSSILIYLCFHLPFPIQTKMVNSQGHLIRP